MGNYQRNDYDRCLIANDMLISSLLATRRRLIIDQIRHRLLEAMPAEATAVAFHTDDRMLALDHTIGAEADDMVFDLDDDLVDVTADEVFAGWSTITDTSGRLIVELPGDRSVSPSGH